MRSAYLVLDRGGELALPVNQAHGKVRNTLDSVEVAVGGHLLDIGGQKVSLELSLRQIAEDGHAVNSRATISGLQSVSAVSRAEVLQEMAEASVLLVHGVVSLLEIVLEGIPQGLLGLGIVREDSSRSAGEDSGKNKGGVDHFRD